MAYISDQNQNNNNNNQQTGQNNAPVVAGSGGAQNSPKATSSGRFNNVSNYIKANQDYNSQGGGLAGQISSNINNQAQNVNQNTQKAQNDFNNQAQQNRVQYNQGAVQGALQNAGNLTDAQKQQFAQMRDAQYKGPQGLNGSQNLQGQVQNVSDLANQTGSENGRFNLLRNMFNNNTYTGGQQRLDNLLLQGNKNQLQQLGQTRVTANQANQNVNNAINQAQGQAQQYGAEANQTQQQTRGALNDYISAYNKRLQDQASQANTNADNAYNTALSNLKQGKMSANDLEKYGLVGKQFYNLDPTQYLTKNNNQATMQNVANAQDYSNIAGLGQLAGNAAQGDVSKFLQSFGDKSQAGTFDPNQSYSFDKNRFEQDENKAIADYKSIVDNYDKQFNSDPNNITMNGFNPSTYQQLTDKYNQGLQQLQDKYGYNNRFKSE